MKKPVILLACALASCNYDDGACYPRDQGGNGVGGGVIVAAGAGGFGDVPPDPQDATDPIPPECLDATESPCVNKCLADYVDEAAKCGKIENETERRACQDVAYLGYKSCGLNCTKKQNDCLDHCKDLCVQIWEGCTDACGKDNVCKERCMRELQECLKECKRKCK